MSSIMLKSVGLCNLSFNQRNIYFSAAKKRTMASRKNLLEEISLTLKSGDRAGLIGVNGAGKSTLLRILGGVLHPDTGVVAIQGQPVCLFSVQLGIQPEISGRDNIFLRGTLLGQSWRSIRTSLDSIIEFSELESVIDQPVYTYSAGMRMRLAFSASTAFQPDILLLDEWIGAGDEVFQQKVRQRMSELVSNSAITVVASHNRKLLKDVCNKGVWLENGRIEKIGGIDDILDVYAERLSLGR